jgi:hypothetical protein
MDNRGFWIAWAVSATITLAFLGLMAWAIVRLVLHFTAA